MLCHVAVPSELMNIRLEIIPDGYFVIICIFEAKKVTDYCETILVLNGSADTIKKITVNR